jgi:sugar phosphate isomerase/epimerase
MDRFAVNEVTTFRWNFLEDVARYSTLGFGGIGLWRHKISDYCDQTVGESVRRAKLKVSSLQWVGGFTGSAGFSFADAIDDAVCAIRSASILQADCLIVHPGAMNGHIRRHAQRLLTDALDSLIPVAQDFGVRLALEPMVSSRGGRQFTFVNDIESTFDVLSRYPTAHLGFVLDLFHLGHDLQFGARIAEVVDRLALVQIADRDGHGGMRRRMPGKGTLDLAGWIRCIEDAGYRGFYEFELFGDEIASRDPFRLLESIGQVASGLESATNPSPAAKSPY